MPLKLLVDENLRSRALRHAIKNISGEYPFDVLFVGDVADLPLRSPDSAIIRFARESQRIVISRDVSTLGSALIKELDAGGEHPGVILLRGPLAYGEIAEWMAFVAYASGADDWKNAINWLP